MNADKNYKIFQDMDGCITDFMSAMYKLGLTIDDLDHSPNHVWPTIAKAGENFWAHMKWCKDGKELWNYVKKYNPTILSAPTSDKSSSSGKRIWVKNELGQNVNVLLCKAVEKQQYSAANAILIDDMKKNIDQWVAKGGIGILHTNTKDTIRQLKRLGL